MVESVLDIWDDIERILIDRNESHRMAGIDRAELESVQAVLLPFREAILQLETSTKYPTLPLVALIYQNLLNSLEPRIQDSSSIANLKEKLLERLKRKLIIDKNYLIATILHPSFWSLNNLEFLTEGEKRRAYSTLRQLVDAYQREPHLVSITNEIDHESIEEPPGKRPRVAADAFLERFCPVRQAGSRNELDRYLAEPVSQVSFADVLNWWKSVSDSYPVLAKIARKFLAIPATSAASESAFRYAGLTVTELRNRLSPETVSNLLFIRHNDE